MEISLHRRLRDFNHTRLSPGFPDAGWAEAIERDRQTLLLEGELLERERAKVSERARSAPSDAPGFLRWYEGLADDGPGQHDPLFPWLARHASLDQVRWFLRQEVAGEAGFDDLVALTQLKMPERAKLELGRNYWDELGRGKASGMHGPMLARLAATLGLDEPSADEIVWESLALGNILIGLAANRRYAYHALGALGVIELTAPGRSALVDEALRRLGVAPHARQYFALHATLDVKHSRAWNDEVIAPIVAAEPRAAVAMAEGALMRLEAGRRCFERYRRELGVPSAEPQPKRRAAPELEGSLAVR